MEKGFNFISGVKLYDKAYRLALRDINLNLIEYRTMDRYEKDLLKLRPGDLVLRAGAGYNEPWTRDTAFNTWNGFGLLNPQVARNTLVSVLKKERGRLYIGHQYWDAVAWTTGAWAYFGFTGDRGFLRTAYEATSNTLEKFEKEQYDPRTGLFTGPASYGDGVSAYPAPYDRTGGSSFILDYVKANPGVDRIRMQALSTNCLYYNAYRIAALMGESLKAGGKEISSFRKKASRVRSAINKRLWLPGKGRYAYFLDADGTLCDVHEGLGHALAILTGVAGPDRAKRILKNQHISPRGIPCTWPLFPRYGRGYGRHNGTVWPHIQGFWATAALERGNAKLFTEEFRRLTSLAVNSGEFGEIYHPVTGRPYGGIQEWLPGRMKLWKSVHHQTWSATAYVRMIFYGVFGMRFTEKGLDFNPYVPGNFRTVRLEGVGFRGMTLDIEVRGPGGKLLEFRLDGRKQKSPYVRAGLVGRHKVEITLKS